MKLATIQHTRVINGRKFQQTHTIKQCQTSGGTVYFAGWIGGELGENVYTGNTLGDCIATGERLAQYRDDMDASLTKLIQACN